MSVARIINKILTSPFRVLGSVFKSGEKRKVKWLVVFIFLLGLAAGFFVSPQTWNGGVDWLNAQKNKTFLKTLPNLPQYYNLPFRLGLDLQGGTHLVYEADLSSIEAGKYGEAMQGVRDVIERRVNLFGVTEPVVQIDQVGDHYRLIVELAGVKDVSQAISMIGETPSLDFRQEKPAEEKDAILEKYLAERKSEFADYICQDPSTLSIFLLNFQEDPCFEPTELSGKYLKSANVNFNPNTYQPLVDLQFDSDGSKIFHQLTSQNVGKFIAIYLDGLPIEIPRVNEAINGGQAQISGSFTNDTAKQLVQRLNAGALPVPITLINQQSVGASLGENSLQKSLRAGLYGLVAVAVFMILWYRLLGLLAVVALLVYTVLVLSLFKVIPVTLTLAGIAGFILSVGMAVDANILIFERIKEELKEGKNFASAVDEGFSRAWPSIRDSNISSLITCVILFWLGTSIIKGFALTLGVGILVSMFSAIFVTRAFLRIFAGTFFERRGWFIKVKKPNNLN